MRYLLIGMLLMETLSDEQVVELADGVEVLIAVTKTLATPAEGAR
jgi:hypothetical protein